MDKRIDGGVHQKGKLKFNALKKRQKSMVLYRWMDGWMDDCKGRRYHGQLSFHEINHDHGWADG